MWAALWSPRAIWGGHWGAAEGGGSLERARLLLCGWVGVVGGTMSTPSAGERSWNPLPSLQQTVGGQARDLGGPRLSPDPPLSQLPGWALAPRILWAGSVPAPPAPSWSPRLPPPSSPPCSGCLWIQGPGDRLPPAAPESGPAGEGGSPACFLGPGCSPQPQTRVPAPLPCGQAALGGGSAVGAKGWAAGSFWGCPSLPPPPSRHSLPAIWGL